jgi:hypothetical protein
MAVGSFTIAITAIPITNALLPDQAGRSIVLMAIPQAIQNFGAGPQTSGNIVWPPASGTVIGTWSYTPPT